MPTIINTKAEFTAITLEELFKRANSSRSGLIGSEAEKRLLHDGPNEVTERKSSPILKFLKYFWGPIAWMIEIAAVLSAVLGKWDDFTVILALLLLNGGVGFWQEFKAGNAIEALKRKLALKARVLRDGRWRRTDARELVIGDIIRLRGGDTVPADLRLCEGAYLQIDESALTGESLPVDKKNGDGACSGSLVKSGEMGGVVVATAMDTLFGKTASLVAGVSTVSHFQKAIIKVGDYLITFAVALVCIVILSALFRHESLLATLQFSLVLTIAAVPVALPAVLSVTMAVGAMAMARKDAIVSKLVAIEEMAGIDVLCSDKTGTITKNQISVAAVRTFNTMSEKEVITCAALCSRKDNDDPIDNAVFKRLKMLNISIERYAIEEYLPFDPVRKRTEATVSNSDGTFKVAKGAPQVILELARSNNEGRLVDDIVSVVENFASRGFRSLGVAKTNSANQWEMIGILALFDPPQDDSAATIRAAMNMGINVKR